MKRGKKKNWVFWGVLIVVVLIILGFLFFYDFTGFVVGGNTAVNLSLGAECSSFGAFACCENCGCAGENQGCSCTCSIVDNKMVWTGFCCDSGCLKGQCLDSSLE